MKGKGWRPLRMSDTVSFEDSLMAEIQSYFDADSQLREEICSSLEECKFHFTEAYHRSTLATNAECEDLGFPLAVQIKK